MTINRYKKMAYNNADDMIFGNAKSPVKAGIGGLEIGAGYTTPEVNYAPRPESGETKDKLVEEYKKITRDILMRMVQIGAPAVVLETEHVQQMTNNPTWGGEIAAAQKAIMENFNDEYGIKCALRHTPGDIRESGDYLQLRGDKYNILMESFEEVASNGADLLSIESMGGKEVFDYAILRNDIPGILFSIGYLGTTDMDMIWQDIVRIAKKNKVVAAGDTDCAQANTAMFIAGGLLDKNLPHTMAIMVRAVAASRTLAAYEAGAVGPGKDCGYEHTIIKSIAGIPISQEGMASTCAHSDVLGNLTMQCCDLWSNESVEYHSEFGGTSVQCWAETLAYNCSLMNVALKLGNAKILRDMFVLSDKYRDPQGYILAYENAYKIGKAIVKDGNDKYLRAKNAAVECVNLLTNADSNLKMTRFEISALKNAKEALDGLTDDSDQFVSDCLEKYNKELKVFKSENYDL